MLLNNSPTNHAFISLSTFYTAIHISLLQGNDDYCTNSFQEMTECLEETDPITYKESLATSNL